MNKKEIFLLLLTTIITGGLIAFFLGYLSKTIFYQEVDLPQREPKDSLENESIKVETKIKSANDDFQVLESFLKNKELKSADLITDSIIQKELISNSVKTLDCTKLKQIDNLWQKYSENKFGYAKQLLLWKTENEITKDPGVAYKNFMDRVGWKVNNKTLFQSDINYDLNAKTGHLPWHSWQVEGKYRYDFGDFVNRVQTCNIR